MFLVILVSYILVLVLLLLYVTFDLAVLLAHLAIGQEDELMDGWKIHFKKLATPSTVKEIRNLNSQDIRSCKL
jgi:hypothetical protein